MMITKTVAHNVAAEIKANEWQDDRWGGGQDEMLLDENFHMTSCFIGYKPSRTRWRALLKIIVVTASISD